MTHVVSLLEMSSEQALPWVKSYQSGPTWIIVSFYNNFNYFKSNELEGQGQQHTVRYDKFLLRQ